MEKLPGDLTDSQLRQVSELLDKYTDMFSEKKYDMGRTHLVEHSIDTGANRPIRKGIRRHLQVYLDIIDKHVAELVSQFGAITAHSDGSGKLHSPWHS